MNLKIHYKQIVISELPNRICIFHLAESKFRAEELYVMGVAQFVEYAEYFMPLYVIVDKTGLDYEVPDVLKDYIKKFGVDMLKRIGVKKVYQISKQPIDGQIPVNKIKDIEIFYDLKECVRFIEANLPQ